MKKTVVVVGFLACVVSAACKTAPPSSPIEFEVIGKVVDANKHQPLAGAQVYLENSKAGAVTNRSGEYRFRATGPAARYVLIAQLIGYQSVRRQLKIERSGPFQVAVLELNLTRIQLDDLAVSACRDYRSPPRDTVGRTVEILTDSLGTYWRVCTRPNR